MQKEPFFRQSCANSQASVLAQIKSKRYTTSTRRLNFYSVPIYGKLKWNQNNLHIAIRRHFHTLCLWEREWGYHGRLNFKCSPLTWISIKSKIQCENSRDENKSKLQLICWKYFMYRFRCVVFVYSRFNLLDYEIQKNAIYKTNTTETATCSKRLKTR